MEHVEKVVVTGYCGDKFITAVLLLPGDDNYECEKILFFTDTERAYIHSIDIRDGSIYMVDSFNNKIYKYDLYLNEQFETTAGRDPRHLYICNENIYVSNFESDNISVVDTESFVLTGSIPAGIKPHDIKFYDEDKLLYVSCYEENKIMELDVQSGKSSYIDTDGKPMHIFVDESSIISQTYFINGNIYSKINFINKNTHEVEKVIKIKGLSSDVDYDTKNKLLYVINIDDKSLYVIDTVKRSILKKIYIGGYPESLSYSPDNIYVTNSKKNQITIIDIQALSVLKNISLEFSPGCIKYMCP